MDTYMQIPRKHRRLRRLLDVRVLKHDKRRLSAQLKHHRLQVLASLCGNLAPDGGAPREVDLAHVALRNQRIRDLGPVLACAANDV